MNINTSLLDMPNVGTFVGRKSEYNNLSQLIQQNRIVIIEGLSGIGKTALATFYAHNTANTYKAVAWHEIQVDESISTLIESIAEKLKAQGQEFLHSKVWGKQQSQLTTIKSLIEQLRKEKILLVLDSFEIFLDDDHKLKAEFENLIDELFRSSFNSNVILTTKIKPRPHPRLLNQYSTIELKGLTDLDSTTLLSELANKHNIQLDVSSEQQIYKATQGHPMALNFVVAALIYGESIQFLLKNLQAVVASEVAPHLINLLYAKLPNDAQRLLKASSAFRKPFTVADINPLQVKADFTELKAFFFIESDISKQRYFLHPIVREYAYKLLKEDTAMFSNTHKSIGELYIAKMKHSRNLEDIETILDVLEAIYHCNKAKHDNGQRFVGNFIANNKTALRNMVKFGEGRLAKKLYEAALKVREDDSELHQFYARLLEGHFSNNPKEIEKHYAESVRLTPENPERQMNYLLFLAKAGKYEQAQEAFERAIAIKECKSSDKVYVPYAKVLLEARKNIQAEKVLEQALPIVDKGSLSQVYIMYGQTLAYQRKFEKAESVFTEGLKTVHLSNGLDDVYIRYSKYFVDRKRFDKAEAVISEAMAKLPPANLVRLYVEYSKLLRQQGKVKQAIAILEEGIKKIPSKFNLYSLYWEYCDLLKSQKDFDGAIDVLRRGIKHVSLEHKGDALILEYGKLARNLGNKQEAEKALRYGIQNTPIGEGLKVLYLDYATLLLFQKRYNEAISCLDEALGRLPKRSHGILNLRRNEIVEEMKKARQKQEKQATKETFENQYFQKGEYTKPYFLFREQLQSATSSIVIIDSYINEEILKTISTLKKEISVLIISEHIRPADFDVQVNKLRRDGYKIKVFKTDMFHDRFLGIDNEWTHSGHSFKDIGSRVSMSTKLDEKRVQQLQKDIDYVLNNMPEFC